MKSKKIKTSKKTSKTYKNKAGIIKRASLPNFLSNKSITVIGPMHFVQFQIPIAGQNRNFVFCGEMHSHLFSTFNTRESEIKHYNNLNNIILKYKQKLYPNKSDLYEDIQTYLDTIDYTPSGMYMLDYLLYIASKGTSVIDIFCETTFIKEGITLNSNIDFLPSKTSYTMELYKKWETKNKFHSVMIQLAFIMSMCNKPYSFKEAILHNSNNVPNQSACKDLFPYVRYHSVDTRYIKSNNILFDELETDITISTTETMDICQRYITALFNNDENECNYIHTEIISLQKISDWGSDELNNNRIVRTNLFVFRKLHNQLKKSVFYEYGIDRFMDTFKLNKYNGTMNTNPGPSKTPRVELTILMEMLNMNLYAMFRMFVNNWKNINDLPHIVFCYFGLSHTLWIFEFVKLWYKLSQSQYIEHINYDNIVPIEMIV